MKKTVYFENLDGLRFLCFLSVFLFHSFHTDLPEMKASPIYQTIKWGIFGNGNIGVNFFFVLSGFLITYLLIEEKKSEGKIHIPSFWLRRALRIWPLYFFCVFFGFVIFPLLKETFGGVPNETADPLYYMLFVNNFDLINKGLPDASILGILWSIAVEEQFYLFWPILLAHIDLKYYWVPFSIILICTFIFRGIYDNSLMHEHHTFSCIGDMTVGAWGAWLVQINEKFKIKISQLTKGHILLIYIAFFTFFFFRDDLFFTTLFARIFERSLLALIILLIILEQNYSHNSFFRMSQFKVISKLGVISYGLYCFHFIGILVTTTLTGLLSFNTELWQVLIFETVLALLITVGISLGSYKFYERPFLRIKNNFAFVIPWFRSNQR